MRNCLYCGPSFNATPNEGNAVALRGVPRIIVECAGAVNERGGDRGINCVLNTQ